MYKDNNEKTLIITDSLIDKIINNESLLKRLSNYDGKDNFFNSFFSREDYVYAISDYLFKLKTRNKKDYLVLLGRFIEHIILSCYNNDIDFLYNLKIISKIYLLKDNFIGGEEFKKLIKRIEKKAYSINYDIQNINEFLNYFIVTKDFSKVNNIFTDKKKNYDIYHFIINNQPLFEDYFSYVKLHDLLEYKISTKDMCFLVDTNPFIKASLKLSFENKEYHDLLSFFKNYNDDCLSILESVELKEVSFYFINELFKIVKDEGLIAEFILKNYFLIDQLSLNEILKLVNDRGILEKIIGLLKQKFINEYSLIDMSLDKYTKILSIIMVYGNYGDDFEKELNNLNPDLINYDHIKNILKLLINKTSIVTVFKSEIMCNFSIYTILKLISDINQPDDFKLQLASLSNIKELAKMQGIKTDEYSSFKKLLKYSYNNMIDKFKRKIYTPELIDSVGIIFPNKLKQLSYQDIIWLLRFMYDDKNSEYLYSLLTISSLFISIANNIKKENKDNFKVGVFYENSDIRGFYDNKNINLNILFFNRCMMNNYDVFVTLFHEIRHARQQKLMKEFPTYNMINQIKDESLVHLYYFDCAGNVSYEDEKGTFNYKRNTLESDAMCNSVIEALRFIKMISVSFYDSIKDELIDSIKKDIPYINNSERILEKNGDIYSVGDLFDAEKTKDEIRMLACKKPILLYEYNFDGSKKDIIALKKDKDAWNKILNEFNWDKDAIKNSRELQKKLGFIKRSIRLYEDLIENACSLSKNKIDLNLNYDFAFENCILALQEYFKSNDLFFLEFVIKVLIDFDIYYTYNGPFNIKTRYIKFNELIDLLKDSGFYLQSDSVFDVIKRLQLKLINEKQKQNHSI